MSFTVTTTVSDSKVGGVVTNAFDSGISYWARVKEQSPFEDSPGAEYGSELPLKGGWVILEDSTGEGFPEDDSNPFIVEGGVILNGEALQRGLNVMAEKYPRHLADLMNDNDDATTADVLIQSAVFGEIVFG